MVYLKDLLLQYPWNSEAKHEYHDKHSSYYEVEEEDANNKWVIPIYEPKNGYAHTGFRIHVEGKDESYTMKVNLVLTFKERNMFGKHYDTYNVKHHVWTPLAYPLTNKIIAIDEDGLSLIVMHPEECYGSVEFVAQRFEDLLENEEHISYAFLDEKAEKVEWIISENNYMFKPHAYNGSVYKSSVKIFPHLSCLLTKGNTWKDTETSWGSLSYINPLGNSISTLHKI